MAALLGLRPLSVAYVLVVHLYILITSKLSSYYMRSMIIFGA
jgi:hypothetical protein